VTRIADPKVPEMTVSLVLDLLIGPDPGPRDYSDEQLELAWRHYRRQFSGTVGPPGDRRPCWAARQFGDEL
jgi:hypothetical protein